MNMRGSSSSLYLGKESNRRQDQKFTTAIIRINLRPRIDKEMKKRTVSQFVTSQYDPLGFLDNTICFFKIYGRKIILGSITEKDK